MLPRPGGRRPACARADLVAWAPVSTTQRTVRRPGACRTRRCPLCEDGHVQNAVPRCLAGDMTPFLDDIGVQLLRTYFDPEAEFSGAAFDTFAGGGDAIARRHTFTADDLVATTL